MTVKKAIHVPGTKFLGREHYTMDDVKTLLKASIDQAKPFYDGRCFHRIKDVDLSTVEVDAALYGAQVIGYEVGPSRCELRMEVAGAAGDMQEQKLSAVVYMDMEHKLYVTDIRDKPIPPGC